MAEKKVFYYEVTTILPGLFQGYINRLADFLNMEPIDLNNLVTESVYDCKGINIDHVEEQKYMDRWFDMQTRYITIGTWNARQDFSERIEAEFGNSYVADAIKKLATLEVDGINYKTTDEAIKTVKEFFAEELEKEANRNIKLFQAGKISRREFDAYVKKYDKAKLEYLPKVEENWSAQKQLRDEMPNIIEKEVQAMQKRAMLKAKAKTALIRIVKSPITLAKFLKNVLKSNRELRKETSKQRRLERETREKMDRTNYAKKVLKTEDEIM